VASNSKREQILTTVRTKVLALGSILQVERKPLQGLADLEAYAQTQLPLAIILGGMPVPTEKFSDRTRKLDKVISELPVTVLVYALDNVTPDSTISTIADDIWVTLYNDITLGYRWVMGLDIKPDANVAVWDPYVAFRMLVNVTYLHDKGGI